MLGQLLGFLASLDYEEGYGFLRAAETPSVLVARLLPVRGALLGALLSVRVTRDALSCRFGSCSPCLADSVWAMLLVLRISPLCCSRLDAALMLLSLSQEPDVMSAL